MINTGGMRPRKIIWKNKSHIQRMLGAEASFCYSWLKLRYGAAYVFHPRIGVVRFHYDT